MEYRVRLYFSEEDSVLIKVKGLSLKEVSDKVAQMIKKGEVYNADAGHYHWNYNLSLVKSFHVSKD